MKSFTKWNWTISAALAMSASLAHGLELPPPPREAPGAAPGSVSTTLPSAPSTTAVAVPVPTFNALLQAWSVDDNSPSGAPSLGFRLRRAELKLSGTIGSRARYLVMADPAKAIRPDGDNRILQDIGVGFKIFPELEIMAGQFKTMTTAEGLGSSSELQFAERSVSGRFFGDRREPGLMIEYNAKPWRVRTMVSNGEGTNADAKKDAKDWTSRIDVSLSRDVRVGAFAFLGDFKWGEKHAVGLNAGWNNGVFGVSAEAAIGTRKGPDQLGVDVEASYKITEEIQPAIRYGFLRPLEGADAANTAQEISLGVNYYLSGHSAKMQISGTWMENLAGNLGSPQIKSGNRGMLVVAAFQAAI